MDEDDVNEEGFVYVVKKVKPAAVCFGSKIEKDTSPIGKGLSPFQKRFGNAEIFAKITPQLYHTDHLVSGVYQNYNKIRSNRGLSFLASRAARFSYTETRNPSPTRYDVLKERKFESSKAPFNVEAKRFKAEKTDIPGPGTYKFGLEKCRRTGLQSNFGRPTVEQAYEVKCIHELEDKCVKCKMPCDLDYWHLDHTIFLCHVCMEEEIVDRDLFKMKKLKKFKRIRTCTFAHDHQGTTAKIYLWERSKVNAKLRKENYLKKYIP